MPRILFLALTLTLLMAAPVVRATVIEDVTVARAVELASDVVIGVISDRRAWRDDGGAFYSDSTVVIEQSLRGGSAAGTSLTVRHLGGQVGAEFMLVPGMPEFAVGERVLLFLTTAPDGSRRTLGLFLGAYTIVRQDGGLAEEAVQKPAGQASLVGRKDGTGLPKRIALEPFLHTLRSLPVSR